jgi:hypothetical protein
MRNERADFRLPLTLCFDRCLTRDAVFDQTMMRDDSLCTVLYTGAVCLMISPTISDIRNRMKARDRSVPLSMHAVRQNAWAMV